MSRLLNVYVAGPSKDLDRCERVILAIGAFASITVNWTIPMRENLRAGIRDTDLTRDERIMYADQDEGGVDRSDVVLWIADGSHGATWEASRAHAKGIELIASGEPHGLFGVRCKHMFATDADAIAYLADLAVRRMRGVA